MPFAGQLTMSFLVRHPTEHLLPARMRVRKADRSFGYPSSLKKIYSVLIRQSLRLTHSSRRAGIMNIVPSGFSSATSSAYFYFALNVAFATDRPRREAEADQDGICSAEGASDLHVLILARQKFFFIQ